MSEKGGQKKTIKQNKNATKHEKLITLRLNDGSIVNANTIYNKNSRGFLIDEVDIDKTKVSDKKLYSKMHDSHKYYVFYEYDNKHIPLKLIFLDVAGCHYTFTNHQNMMNFFLMMIHVKKSLKYLNILKKIRISY